MRMKYIWNICTVCQNNGYDMFMYRYNFIYIYRCIKMYVHCICNVNYLEWCIYLHRMNFVWKHLDVKMNNLVSWEVLFLILWYLIWQHPIAAKTSMLNIESLELHRLRITVILWNVIRSLTRCMTQIYVAYFPSPP